MLQRLALVLSAHSRKVAYIIAALILAAGALYAFRLGEQLRYIDERDYLALADHLAQLGRYTSDGVIPAAFRPLGYPLLLALPRLLGAPIFALRMLNFAALAGISLGLYFWIEHLFKSPLLGLIGALLPVCYPVLFYTAGTLYPQIIGAFLLLVWVALAASDRHIVWAGWAGSLLLIMIPAMTFVLPILMIGQWLRHRWRSAILLGVISLALPLVWTARNRIIFGAWVYVSANSGFNLFLGNSAEATATSGVNVDHSALDAATSGLDDAQKDRLFREAAVAWIQANPARAAALYGQKLLNHFNFRNQLYTESESSSSNNLVMLATYYPLLGLALLRVLLFRRWPLTWSEALVSVIYILAAFTSAVFFTRIRLRLPFDILLMLLVVGLFAPGRLLAPSKPNKSLASGQSQL